MRLARSLGVLDRLELIEPHEADEAQLLTVHDAGYLAAVRTASTDPTFTGYGLGTDDDPVFAGMYDASALIAGGSAQAAQQLWSGAVEHAVNIAGGLHHAMRGYASGFCVFNDVVLGINTLLAAGAKKVAYVDIDVHHGDGVQAAFYDDPRVLTISLHQDPRTLFPGTGFPTELGTGAAEGTSINVALPPGTDDDGWLRAFRAVVPSAVRAFAPGRPGHAMRLRHPPRGSAGEPGAVGRRATPGHRRTAPARARRHRRQVAGLRRRRLRPGALRAAHLDAPAGRSNRRARRSVHRDPRGVDRAPARPRRARRTAGSGWARDAPRNRPRGRPAAIRGSTARSARPAAPPSRCSDSIRTIRVTEPVAPPHWEADVVVADGGTVHLRPIRPERRRRARGVPRRAVDAHAVPALLLGLSANP